MARNKHVSRIMRGIFGRPTPLSSRTTVLPNPLNNGISPWYFTPGPVFNPGADGAILNSRLSKPHQTVFGYAYRVRNPQKFTPLQPSQLYAPKGVPMVGINIQTGWEQVTSPAVNSDGSWVSNDEGQPIQQFGLQVESGSLTNETDTSPITYF